MARQLSPFEKMQRETEEKRQEAEAKREKTLFFKKAAEAGFSQTQVEFLWKFSKNFAKEYHRHAPPLSLMRF